MLLSIENLDVFYGVIQALHGVSLHIDRGEIVTLIGANGAGKTTLLRAISGLLKPEKGSIAWNAGQPVGVPPLASVQTAAEASPPSGPGVLPYHDAPTGPLYGLASNSPPPAPSHASRPDKSAPSNVAVPNIEHLAAHEIVSLGISHVPEGRQIFANLSVIDNLMLGAYQRRDADGIHRNIEGVYARFPILAERRRQGAGTLSGGEQQMLAIGRALMARPQLLLLDEPSLGLAPLVVRKIFEIIREINAAGTTVFLVEQNAHMALNIAHRAYVLQTGRIIKTDSAKSLLDDPDVKKAYLGG